MRCGSRRLLSVSFAVAVVALGAAAAQAELELEAPQIVQDAGADLSVPGFSVPSCADWDADGAPDLIVGEGGGGYPDGRVRIYRNVGTATAPAFAGYVYAEADGDTLVWPAAGCLGLFPRVVHWDDDGRKDLLVGTSDGTLRIYHNVGSDAAPLFDAGAFVQAGEASPEDIDVGSRATPIWVDWNLDGRHDLLVGAVDGCLRLYLDTAATGEPQLAAAVLIQADDEDLVVPGLRSSPAYADCDDDGRRDLLLGNTAGQLLLYGNLGTDAEPVFSGYTEVAADGHIIDLIGEARSRPCVCDWTDSGRLDVLIGAGDGLVYLFAGQDSVSAVPLPLAIGPLAAYPNPFNPRVNLVFTLAESQPVVLAVYSLAGHRVAAIVVGDLSAGEQRFTWDGRDSRGRDLPAGQYIVRLSGPGNKQHRKITLLR